MITEEVVSLAVFDMMTGDLIGLRRLRGTDFREAGAYQEFHLDFESRGDTRLPLEFRISFPGVTEVSFDRLIVLDYPVPYRPHPAAPYPELRLKLIDAAGNVSDDLLISLEIVDDVIPYRIYLPLMMMR